MGRKSSFVEADVYTAVAAFIAPGGAFAIKDVSGACGVSTGSLYHRFGSREGLLIEACLDATTAFFDGFHSALSPGGIDAGRAAAVWVTQFCRMQPGRAQVLLCNSPSGLSAMGTDSAALNDILQQVARFDAAIEAFATSIGCDSDRARLAVFELPLQVVRFYLPERVVPNAADHYVVQVYNGLLLAE